MVINRPGLYLKCGTASNGIQITGDVKPKKWMPAWPSSSCYSRETHSCGTVLCALLLLHHTCLELCYLTCGFHTSCLTHSIVVACPLAKGLHSSCTGWHFLGVQSRSIHGMGEAGSFDTHPPGAAGSIWGQLQRSSAPPLNLRVMLSPVARFPSPPLGLICDEREVRGVTSTGCWHGLGSVATSPGCQMTSELWHCAGNDRSKPKRWCVMPHY